MELGKHVLTLAGLARHKDLEARAATEQGEKIGLVAKRGGKARQPLANHLDHLGPALFRPFLADGEDVDRGELHHERLDAVERGD